MEVSVIKSTENPEEVVCRAARGDYTGTTFTNRPSHDEKNEGGKYVRRGDGEGTGWIEPPKSFKRVMEGVEGETLEEKKRTLIEHLLRSGHYGPFEHPQITLAIKGVSRVTMAQITRHRQLTFDIQSMRYIDFSEGGDAVVPKSLVDDEHFTRGEGEVEVENREYWMEKYREEVESIMGTYEAMIEDGVPAEDARYLLPLGTCVNMTVSGNARTWMHILNIRGKANVQWETREMAEQIEKEMKCWMPATFDAYDYKKQTLSP